MRYVKFGFLVEQGNPAAIWERRIGLLIEVLVSLGDWLLDE